MSLFVAILGVGGCYTCIFVLIREVVPQKNVGKATVLIVTVGATAAVLAPLIALLDAPVPFIVNASLMFLSMAISFGLDYLLRTQTGQSLLGQK